MGVDKQEVFGLYGQEIYHIPLNNLTPEEDDVFFTQTILPQIRDLPQNLIHIWYYCFTEMMNNVIDHSQAKEATVVFARDAVNTTVLLQDNGIGIFQRFRIIIICRQLKMQSWSCSKEN